VAVRSILLRSAGVAGGPGQGKKSWRMCCELRLLLVPFLSLLQTRNGAQSTRRRSTEQLTSWAIIPGKTAPT